MASANDAVDTVVGITVMGLVTAYLIPIAINELEAVSTSSWSEGAASIWGVLSVIVVLAIFIGMVNMVTAEA